MLRIKAVSSLLGPDHHRRRMMAFVKENHKTKQHGKRRAPT